MRTSKRSPLRLVILKARHESRGSLRLRKDRSRQREAVPGHEMALAAPVGIHARVEAHEERGLLTDELFRRSLPRHPGRGVRGDVGHAELARAGNHAIDEEFPLALEPAEGTEVVLVRDLDGEATAVDELHADRLREFLELEQPGCGLRSGQTMPSQTKFASFGVSPKSPP